MATTPVEKKLTLHYIIIHSLFLLSACSISGFTSYFFLSNGYSSAETGMAIAIGNLLSLLLQPHTAQFADRAQKISLRHIIAAISSSSLLCSLILYISPARTLLFVPMYVLMMCFISLQVPLITSLSTEHINNGTRVNFSIARGFGSIAFAGMSVVMGMLTKKYGPNITLLSYAALNLVYLLSVWTFPSPDKPMESKFDIQALKLFDFMKRNPRFMYSVVAMFFIYSSAAIISCFLFPIVQSVGGDSAILGNMLAVAASVELVAMLCYPIALKLLKSNANILKFAAIAFLIKAIFTWQANTVGELYFAQFLQFFCYGFFIPAQVYYVLQNISMHDQVKGQMFMTFSSTLAVVFASSIGGFMLKEFGVYTTLALGVGLTIFGIILLYLNLEADKNTFV